MSDFPTGTVTFLFTDIEGSTTLAQQFPASCATFSTASDTLIAALDAQHALYAAAWGETGPLRAEKYDLMSRTVT